LVFYDFRKSFFFAALDNQWALVVDWCKELLLGHWVNQGFKEIELGNLEKLLWTILYLMNDNKVVFRGFRFRFSILFDWF
jgi:hypothetical protein